MVDGCGSIYCHPKWLQKFASSRWFMVIFGLLGIIQSASYSYFVVSLSTIEKRFKIPSQTTGIILSGNEISQILLSFILSYVGSQKNRPRWIAWGVIITAVSCFILAAPHFIFGAGEDALKLTNEHLSIQNVTNGQFSEIIPALIKSKLCQIVVKSDDCDEIFSYLPLILIFLSQFVLGIGNTQYYVLGQSYLDDNTDQKNMPLVLAYSFVMRLLGPVLGIGLAYLCLNIYIDPTVTPIITKTDSRWLGAWWLGWILIGGLMFIVACFIGMFPKHLSKKKEQTQTITDKEEYNTVFKIAEDSDHNKETSFNDFCCTLMRLLRNKVIICNNLAAIFHIIGSSIFMTFMSRIMEIQFKQSSHGGSIIAGPVTIMGIACGLLLSGYYISKRKPLPKYLFFWNVIVGLVSMSNSLAYANLGCDDTNTLMLNGSIRSCNENCFCDSVSYSPICDNVTQETFFSPCHSGCMDYDAENKVYTNCFCTEFARSNDIRHPGRHINSGTCFGSCDFAYKAFTIIAFISGLLASTACIGNVLVSLRAVESRDKSISQGLTLFLVSLFALIPGPIIFGRIIDSTCLSWIFKCGRQGNCQLYDSIKFRHLLHYSSAGFRFVAVFFDILVWYFGKDMNLYGDNDVKKPDESTESVEKEPLNK